MSIHAYKQAYENYKSQKELWHADETFIQYKAEKDYFNYISSLVFFDSQISRYHLIKQVKKSFGPIIHDKISRWSTQWVFENGNNKKNIPLPENFIKNANRFIRIHQKIVAHPKYIAYKSSQDNLEHEYTNLKNVKSPLVAKIPMVIDVS